MDSPRPVAVSPRHRVILDEDYLAMIDRAPREDFVVRTLAKRTAGPLPLMTADAVIAGETTRELYPLAARYPLHFRKTYYPGSLFGHPRVEFERQELAARLVGVPPPIGYTSTTFRSCLLPGTPLDKLSPLGTEPDHSNIKVARELPLASLAGLWRLLEETLALVRRLQTGGLAHGDAHLHNFMVCSSPLEVIPIDFEIAQTRDELDDEAWQARCAADVIHLYKLAIYVQCALGEQRGALAEESMRALDTLVAPADAFQRAIEERTHDGL